MCPAEKTNKSEDPSLRLYSLPTVPAAVKLDSDSFIHELCKVQDGLAGFPLLLVSVVAALSPAASTVTTAAVTAAVTMSGSATAASATTALASE